MDEVVAGVGESPPASSTESYQANLFTVEDIIVLMFICYQNVQKHQNPSLCIIYLMPVCHIILSVYYVKKSKKKKTRHRQQT